jgi:hypothetical protein
VTLVTRGRPAGAPDGRRHRHVIWLCSALTVEYHWLGDQYDRAPALMADLVRRRVAVITTPGLALAVFAAKAAAMTIPLIFSVGGDLDGTKIHANASRHSALSYEHAGKIEAQLKAEVAELLARAEAADQADVADGMSIPEELARREERLAKFAEARAKLEARAKERFERETELPGVDRKPARRKNHSATSWRWSFVGSRSNGSGDVLDGTTMAVNTLDPLQRKAATGTGNIQLVLAGPGPYPSEKKMRQRRPSMGRKTVQNPQVSHALTDEKAHR